VIEEMPRPVSLVDGNSMTIAQVPLPLPLLDKREMLLNTYCEEEKEEKEEEEEKEGGRKGERKGGGGGDPLQPCLLPSVLLPSLPLLLLLLFYIYKAFSYYIYPISLRGGGEGGREKEALLRP